MKILKLLILCLQYTLILFVLKISAQFDFLHSKCGNITFTPNSTYHANLKTVLNSLSSNTQNTYGYYNSSAGHDPDEVQAMVLCRGDVPVRRCQLCVNDSMANLPIVCPNKKTAFGYTDNCISFYSNTDVFHTIRARPLWGLWNNKNVSNVVGFNETLVALMSKLQTEASLGDSKRKFATAQTNLTLSNQTLYGLVQCSPDLSRLQCTQCVQNISIFFLQWFVTPTFIAAGARLLTPSCNLRYEIYSFYGNVSEISLPPAPPSDFPESPASNRSSNATAGGGKRKKSHNSTAIIIPVAVVGGMILIIAAFVCILLKKGKKSSSKFNKEDIETLQSLQYSLRDLKLATENFSEDNKVGEGGFGTVYKGNLPDGKEVAVKRLTKNAAQGDLQFKNEILLLAKLQHRNLVRLLGFCLEDEELLLVYEFVLNRSLDHFIFDPVERASMQWETRYNIINGIARGLLYLHEDSRLRIIHRDLKAGNVLLDAKYNPKIADFGMARLFNIDQTQAVASKIVGTYGYMPPEYALHGHVTVKSDVFSFGVLVLEIISGQRISCFQIGDNAENLLTFAWKSWLEGNTWNLVDPELSAASSTEILRCIHIGLLCVQHSMTDRPTMSSVDLMLNSDSVSLQVPSQPAFFTRSRTPSVVPSQGNNSDQSTSKSSSVACSINEVTVTEVYPR